MVGITSTKLGQTANGFNIRRRESINKNVQWSKFLLDSQSKNIPQCILILSQLKVFRFPNGWIDEIEEFMEEELIGKRRLLSCAFPHLMCKESTNNAVWRGEGWLPCHSNHPSHDVESFQKIVVLLFSHSSWRITEFELMFNQLNEFLNFSLNSNWVVWAQDGEQVLMRIHTDWLAEGRWWWVWKNWFNPRKMRCNIAGLLTCPDSEIIGCADRMQSWWICLGKNELGNGGSWMEGIGRSFNGTFDWNGGGGDKPFMEEEEGRRTWEQNEGWLVERMSIPWPNGLFDWISFAILICSSLIFFIVMGSSSKREWAGIGNGPMVLPSSNWMIPHWGCPSPKWSW